jgi:hypothetical protein
MEVINKSNVASVEISDIRVSEDELGVYQAAISYLLDTLSSDELVNRFGATRDELEGMRDDLREADARHKRTTREPALTS